MYIKHTAAQSKLSVPFFLISFVIEQHGKRNRGTVSSAKVAAVLLI